MRPIDADALRIRLANETIFKEREYVHGWNSAIKIIENAPTIDAVPVVRCEKCVLHGNCTTEDAFVFAGIDNPFCCSGKRKGGVDNG